MNTRAIQEAAFAFRGVRWTLAAFMWLRGRLFMRAGNLYRGLLDLCWVVRVSDVAVLSRRVRPQIVELSRSLSTDHGNALVDSYLANPASAALAVQYALNGSGPLDVFRDLIVLKKFTPGEKGVILLKYARTFEGVITLFDLPRLMERYIFVLEPCWAGYCHPTTLMYLAKENPVFIQCFTDEDFEFVRDVGAPLVPLRLGPADWVDADLFSHVQAAEKRYDLVMVANWSPQKRHAFLFRTLEQIRDRDVRVLVIGFPWAHRTAEDVRREAAAIRNPRVHVDVMEKVPQAQLAGYISQCKAFVFLNRKEGDNKALVEAMFADVPAIVYDRTIGGARSRINPATGILASDRELTDRIRYMLDHYRDFSPRAWIREHSGSAIATRKVDDAIRRAVVERGGRYTEGIVEKTNAPNLAYKDPAARARFEADYRFIRSCRREAGAVVTHAVA